MFVLQYESALFIVASYSYHVAPRRFVYSGEDPGGFSSPFNAAFREWQAISIAASGACREAET
jgi:hypothetical protein